MTSNIYHLYQCWHWIFVFLLFFPLWHLTNKPKIRWLWLREYTTTKLLVVNLQTSTFQILVPDTGKKYTNFVNDSLKSMIHPFSTLFHLWNATHRLWIIQFWYKKSTNSINIGRKSLIFSLQRIVLWQKQKVYQLLQH